MKALLLAVCVAAAAPPAVAGPQVSEPYSRDWKRLRSEHFVAAGNADYASMRSVLAELEGFRRALLRSLPSLRVSSALPTTVVLFKDDASFARFRPLDENGRRRDRVAAYLLSGPAASYLVVPMHRDAARTFHYVFHEYTHFIVRENMGEVPEWLNEGLAEFYSTFRVAPRERRAVLGEPPRNRLPALTSGGRLPLRDLLTMDRAARASAGAARQQAFYAQSWALVHFLNLGDGGRHRAGIATYLAAVAKGVPVEEAVPAAFGLPLHDLELAIASYSQRPSFPSLQLDEPEGTVAIRTTLEAMLERDVAALQRELQALLARTTAPPHDVAQIRADLEARLAPVAAWRKRTEEALRARAGTPQADAEFLDLRIQLKAIVATIARDLEAPEFQRLMFPDGAAGQAFRRAQRRPFDAEASELVEADALMTFMKERGVWPHRAEGDIYFYVSEAALLEWFGPFVSDEIRQFLRLWADEQVHPAAEDASIQVDLDELERRIRATERFLAAHLESDVRHPVRVRHQQYLALYLGGTDNTPAFDSRSGALRSDLRQRLEAYAATQRLTPSGQAVASYLDLLRKTGFARTPEVRRFLDRVRGDVRDWRLLQY